MKLIARLVLIAAAVFVAGRFGLLMPYFNSSISLFWMPTGIAVAAITLYDAEISLAVFVGAFLPSKKLGRKFWK